jgi:PAS domain S-box-containing protein
LGVALAPLLLLCSRRVRRSLSARLTVGFLLVSLTPLGLLAWLDQRVVQETLLKNTRQTLYGAATQAASDIDRRLQTTLDAVRADAQSPEFFAVLALPPEERQTSSLLSAAQGALVALRRRDPALLDSYALLDASGVILADTYAPDIGQDRSGRDYFQSARANGAPSISTLAFSGTEGALSVYFASPVRNAAGALLGVLRARYKAEFIQQLVTRQKDRLGPLAQCLLLDEQGLRIADTGAPTENMAPMTPLDPARLEGLIASRRTTPELGRRTANRSSELRLLMERARQERQSPFFEAKLRDTDPERTQLASVALSMQPWLLLTGLPLSESRVGAQQQARNAIALLAGFAALVIVAAYFLSQRVSLPILRLKRAAQAMAEGDLSARASGAARDPFGQIRELGELGASFDAMADKLALSIRGLETKIQELGDVEKALRRSEANYRSIVDNASEGIFQLDGRNRLITANPALAAMLGFDSPERLVAAYNANSALFFIDMADPERLLQRIRQEGRICGHELRVLRKDKKAVWVSVNAHLALSEQGEPLVEGAFMDVSLRKRAERRLDILNRHLQNAVRERTKRFEQKALELEAANERLLRLDEMKSSFISSVSHELRTPLTSILGFAKLIGKDFSNRFLPLTRKDELLHRFGQRILSNVGIIQNEGQRLTRLIGDLLDLSKIESGKLKWMDQECRIDELVKNAVASGVGLFDLKPDVKLVVEAEEDAPLLLVDPDRVTQVVLNLLHNAVKFTFAGEVRVSAQAFEGGALVRVADTGAGVPPEELDKIFLKFHQVWRGEGNRDKPHGVGLGLSICREIVEHYQGRIWAESVEGKGSVFSFTLPGKAGKDRATGARAA